MVRQANVNTMSSSSVINAVRTVLSWYSLLLTTTFNHGVYVLWLFWKLKNPQIMYMMISLIEDETLTLLLGWLRINDSDYDFFWDNSYSCCISFFHYKWGHTVYYITQGHVMPPFYAYRRVKSCLRPTFYFFPDVQGKIQHPFQAFNKGFRFWRHHLVNDLPSNNVKSFDVGSQMAEERGGQ